MSRLIYDNWERLVEAILREEQLRQLAYASSRSPSISTNSSSRFSSSFDDVSFTFSSPVSYHNTSSPDSGKEILPVVETRAIKQQISDPPTRWILRLIPGIFRSKKAKKRPEFMVNSTSTPSLPEAMAPHIEACEFASRKQIEDEIIKAMRYGYVNVIGLSGMKGVGKTMMAKQIMNRAREKEGLFDEVVMVVVGQQANLLKIQHDIVEWLGMKFEDETLVPRANRLRARLMADGKRTLIVIDDIWERIDLEGLGIPCHESELCKVFLTARDRHVLNQMDAHKIFTVKELNEDEAWRMFKEYAGDCLDDHSNLLPIAREVAKECNGLPLALVAVARALKGNKDSLNKHIWSHALKQLKSGNPKDISGVIKDVYNSIRLSYDFLENEENAKSLKSLWFLCSSLPEDYDISLEDLTFYEFGLASLDDHEINNLEEARDKVTTLVGTLKSRFLILDGGDEYHVKMHDVVRDVAILIASEEKRDILHFSSMECLSRRIPHLENCTTLLVVLKKREIELPIELSFSTLHFLWMDDSRFRQLQLSDHFFKGMQQLKVLYMKSFSFTTLPQTMQLLKNLHTLYLFGCMSLETLYAIGELSSLQILICRNCYSITELPKEIGRLNRLLILDVSDCHSLKTIMPGVISNLVRLEELKMLSSFKKWESNEKGNDKSNASLTELESLGNLTCLGIEIEDWSLAAKELQLASRIEKYKIIVGKITFDFRFLTHEKLVALNFPTENSSGLGNWIRAFAKNAESLWLKGGASHSLDFAGYTQNKRFLSQQDIVTFGSLKELTIEGYNKDDINYLWRRHIPHSFFAGLETLHIVDCANIRNLFSHSIAGNLVNLKRLDISRCNEMVCVIGDDINTETTSETNPKMLLFHKLERLNLQSLLKLQIFSKGKWDLQFPSLTWVVIRDCPVMGFTQNLEDSCSAHQYYPHLFCNTKDDTFGCLKELTMGGYEMDISYLWCHLIPHPSFFAGLETLHIVDIANIHNLFSYSIAGELVSLKRLEIIECNEMVCVIGDDINTEVTSKTSPQTLIFHKLEVLVLMFLPKLQSFCEGKCDLQFLSLKQVNIDECPRMEGFTMGSLSTPNMENFEMDGQMKNVEELIKYPWQQL